MSPSLDGIELFMQVVLNSKPWNDDLSLHQTPWRIPEPTTKKLTVGVIWDDGVVKPSPPVLRALKEVVEKLKDLPDVEVIDWAPYKHDEAMKLLVSPRLFEHVGFELVSLLTQQPDKAVRSRWGPSFCKRSCDLWRTVASTS